MKIRHLLPLFVLLLIAPLAWGTCTPTSSGYSEVVDMYTDVPTNGTPATHVYVSVVVSGTSTMPANCAPQQVKHTPRAYNNFNGVGGYASGTPVCPSCFAQASNLQSVAFTEEFEGTASEGGDVSCTVAGTFLTFAVLPWRIEEAVTKSKNVGGAPGHWNLQTWCDPSVGVPDFHPTVVDNVNTQFPYFIGLSICTRKSSLPAGSPWNCFTHNPAVAWSINDNQPTCTNFDRGTNMSFPWPQIIINQ